MPKNKLGNNAVRQLREEEKKLQTLQNWNPKPIKMEESVFAADFLDMHGHPKIPTLSRVKPSMQTSNGQKLQQVIAGGGLDPSSNLDQVEISEINKSTVSYLRAAESF